MTGVYDPKPDIDAFYGAMADGTLADVDVDSVFDLVDRVSEHPGEALRSLRMEPFEGMTPDTVRRPLLDAYYDRRAAVPHPDAGVPSASTLFDAVERVVRVSGNDLASAYEMDDTVAIDRMLDTYYRS